MGKGSDTRAIRNLIDAYTDAASRLDAAAGAATYAEDGVLVANGVELRGRAKIERAFARNYGASDLIFQMIQPGPLEIRGDRAFTRSWIRAWNRLKGETTRDIFGLYQDELVRTPEGWRFARRRMDTIHIAENGQVLEDHGYPPMEHAFEIGRDPARV
jgi:ketosteroid isomerase-like protein